MCDSDCAVGLGITGGIIGIMMSIFFCNIILSMMIESTEPIVSHKQLHAEIPTSAPTVIDMPITIRIYLPQQGILMNESPRIQIKNQFEPVPYVST